MNRVVPGLLVACFLLLLLFESVAVAQSPADSSRGTSKQPVSHQMDQPPPDAGSKDRLSDERLDEIQRLYLQAKQEQEARAKTQAKGPEKK